MDTSLKHIMSNAFVLDLETTIVPTTSGYSPAPWHGAHVVAAGWMNAGEVWWDPPPPVYVEYATSPDVPPFVTQFADRCLQPICAGETRLLVGHNIKFDLAHLLWPVSDSDRQIILGNCEVWDTMIAEYYLSAQQSISPSLETVCEYYKIPFTKDSTVTEAFKCGLGSDCIDRERLLHYLRSDVSATGWVFRKQVERALALGGPAYVNFLLKQMGASLATCGAEIEGCQLNVHGMQEREIELQRKADEMKLLLEKKMLEHFPDNCAIPPSIDSPKALCTFLYGGDVECISHEKLVTPDGHFVRYKSGKKKGEIRTKKVKDKVQVFGLLTYGATTCLSDMKVCAETNNFSSVNERALRSIHTYLTDWLAAAAWQRQALPGHLQVNDACNFVELLLNYRSVHKDLGTYYTGLLNHVSEDQRIHPSYNHAIAKTKRLTSSGPNFQNISNKNVSVGEDDGGN